MTAPSSPNESARIADQLHRAFFGGPWHGPSLKEVLDGVRSEMAEKHSIAAAHSIWELVHHVRAWTAEADATVRGKPYESLTGEKDWPPVTETSAEAWEAALTALERAELSLEQAVRELPPERLGEGDRSLYDLLHGIAQHNAYHAGQIVLLKKFGVD